MIRLYADYADPADCHLVSSWRGLPDSLSLIPPRGKGLISDWHQRTGHLWVGGHSSQIRIWDAGRETAVADLPTRSDKSGVCSLSVDPSNGSLVVAGFLDGRIRVYDGRVSPSESLVHEFAKEHSREILRARFLPQGQSTLLAGSADGSVKLWDMRHLDSVKTFVTRMEQDTMTGFDIHPMAPIFVWYGYFAERWKQHLGSVHYYETQWRFNAEHTCNDLGGRRKAFGHDQVYRELLVRQKNGASWTLVLSPATLALGGKLIEFPGRVSFCRTNGSCQLRVVNVYPKKCRLGLLSNNQYKLCKEDGIFSIDEG